MARLPASTPPAYVEGLTAALAAHGVTLGPLKDGSGITRTVEHRDHTWTVTYMGLMHDAPFWCVRGPEIEHGVGAFDADVIDVLNGSRGY